LVAYSGGLDSHVLLHALSSLSKQDASIPPVVAVHVNHQIQSMSDDWQAHCQQQANQLGVEFLSYKVSVDSSRNIEANAREARYQVFENLVQKNDYLFFAHHQQDQAETFLYRFFRGAGVAGLLAMKKTRAIGKGQLVRPLLHFSRNELEQYANEHGLLFVSDPSNNDISYDRNYIRHQIVPVITKRWPQFQQVARRTMQHLQESQHLLDEVAEQDLQQLNQLIGAEPAIDFKDLKQFSAVRQNNVVRYWLAKHNVVLSTSQFEQLLHHVIQAAVDATPVLVVGEKSIRRYRNYLYITPTSNNSTYESIQWYGSNVCDVPAYGTLQLSKPVDVELRVEQRKGGESIKPKGSTHTRKLKTLLQELDIPPWQRDTLPLIYCQDQLIAIADTVLAEDADKYLQGATIQKA
jgi:tRNA(Ile)-lysidine synthase